MINLNHLSELDRPNSWTVDKSVQIYINGKLINMNVEVKAQLALECLKIARTLVEGDDKLLLQIADNMLQFCLRG